MEVVKFTLELEVTMVKVEGSTTVSSPAPPTQKTGGGEGILWKGGLVQGVLTRREKRGETSPSVTERREYYSWWCKS